MDAQTIQKPLTEFRNAISDTISVNEFIVFGSHLEGTAQEDSDIDIVMVSDDFKTMDDNQRLDLLYRKSVKIRPESHPWAFTPKELARASTLTTWGYAREHGIHFSS